MPPIRADHGLAYKKGSSHSMSSSAGGEAEERPKQARRNVGVQRRHSPSHSRTPSPNQQVSSGSGSNVLATPHGHVVSHGTRRSPSSKASGGSSSRSVLPDGVGGSREKRPSPDPTRKGYAHGHIAQRGLGSKSPAFGPVHKGSSSRAGSGRTTSSPTPGVSGRALSSPTPTLSSNTRGHSSPILSKDIRSESADTLVPAAQSSVRTASPVLLPVPIPCGTQVYSAATVGSEPSAPGAEAREMTPLDRVFLEQPHEGRKDVESDDLPLLDEMKRLLQSRVQSQLAAQEATNRNNSTSAVTASGSVSASGAGTRGVTSVAPSGRSRSNFSSGNLHLRDNADPTQLHDMETIHDDDCYSPDPVHRESEEAEDFASMNMRRGGSSTGGYESPVPMTIGSNDMLDDPNMGSTGVPPVSPSSGGGPAQGLVLDVDMDFRLSSGDGRGRDGRDARDSRAGPGSRSPLGSALAPDVQMSDAGGDGQLREVVNGLDAMGLDAMELDGMKLHDVDRALALLTAKKHRMIAQKHAGAAAVAAAAAAEAEAQAQAMFVPPPQPPLIAANGGSNRSGSGSRQRRSGSSRNSRHSGEGSPSAGGRSEAFGLSGGGARGAPSFTRTSRGQGGRPPPVPGHTSASTAAARRSSPANFASLAELDSYLEHHHRRLVEQVEGGVVAVADDVEAEIRASRYPRRGTRSNQRFGGTSSGFGSSSSSGGVPRTVGARVSTKQFFSSSQSADGDGTRDWHSRHGRSSRAGRQSHSLIDVDEQIRDPPSHRGHGYKRERGELRGDGANGGWGAGSREFRGDGGRRDRAGFMGVSGSTYSQGSSPPSIMSSDEVSVSSYGHTAVVLPGSPNNITFGRHPPSRIRLEAVRSPVVRHGRATRGRGVEEGLVFTSPDASKHVQELTSPRSAFTPRSASSVSSLASSPARRR